MSSSDRTSMLLKTYEDVNKMLENQLQLYENTHRDLKNDIESLLDENERLRSELKGCLQFQVPEHEKFGTSSSNLNRKRTSDDYALSDHDNLISNLKEQVNLSNQEKEDLLQLWQVSLVEIENLEKLNLERNCDSDVKAIELRTEQAINLYMNKLSSMEVELKSVKAESSKSHLSQLSAEENAKKLENIILRRNKDFSHLKDKHLVAEKERDDCLNRVNELIQESFSTELRCSSMKQELSKAKLQLEALHSSNQHLEDKIKYMENNEYLTVEKIKDNNQLTETALLERDAALLSLQQAHQQVDRLNKTVLHLMDEAGHKVKAEVVAARRQCNDKVRTLMEEISSIQEECDHYKSQVERLSKKNEALESTIMLDKFDAASTEEQDPDCRNRPISVESHNISTIRVEHLKNRIDEIKKKYEQERKIYDENAAKISKELSRCQDNLQQVSNERLELVKKLDESQELFRKSKRDADLSEIKYKLMLQSLNDDYGKLQEECDAKIVELKQSHVTSKKELQQRLLTSHQKPATRVVHEHISYRHKTEMEMAELRRRCKHLLEENNNVKKSLSQAKVECHQKQLKLEHFQNEFSKLDKRLIKAEQIINVNRFQRQM